jgi:L-cysteine desulfidase
MIGPGKYDAIADTLRNELEADGLVLIVFGGRNGSGCSMKVTDQFSSAMPGLLRKLADAQEADLNKITGGRN